MLSVHLSHHPEELLIQRNSGNRLRSLLLTLPIAAMLWISLLQNRLGSLDLFFFAGLSSFIFFVSLFYLMQYTGRTYQYRRILFITMSACMVIGLASKMIDAGGLMTSSGEDRLLLNHKFCPLAIPMTVIPALVDRIVIFPGSLIDGRASFGAVLIMWAGSSLAIGRGFCSWFCIFGGFDEAFSAMNKRPRLIIRQVWTLLPYAVLFSTILLSAKNLEPIFCYWLCPWKTVSRVTSPESWHVFLITFISWTLFLVLVVVLPVLTGKRTQCSIFCPFVALQSFTNRFNIFDVRIDREKCTGCQSCIRHCPTLSLDVESMGNGRTLTSCTKCSKCIDICHQQALSYHIKGTPVGKRTQLARTVFLYTAYILGGVIGGSMLAKAIANIAVLFTA